MTTKTGIIFLQRDKFQIYSPYLPSMFEFRFIPDIVRDYDIVNRELLENLLKVFIVNNKIPVSSMVIVVSDSASFIKDFTAPSVPPPPNPAQTPPAPTPAVPTLEDLQKQADQFIEHVPFELVSGKTYPLPNGVKAYATNKEMFDTIISVLEKQGFIIEAVIPGFAFGPEVSAKPGMDGASINITLQKMNMLKAYNLLTERKPVVEAVRAEVVENNNSSSEVPPSREPKDNKKIILIAIASLVVLFAVTGWILASQFSEKPYSPPPTPTPASAPTAVPQTSVSPTTLNASDLTVQIVSPSSATVTAATLASQLEKYGFKSISPQTQDSTSAPSGLLIFSEKVSVEVRNVVTVEVKKVAPNIVIQEKAGSLYDIVVILSQ